MGDLKGPVFHLVNAFSEEPGGGNPAAVCILEGPADEKWMQESARRIGVSETAFLYRNPEGTFRLRWFSPALEVELCGHATLAAAFVLWEENRLPRGEEAVFETLSGRLTAVRREPWIELDFPADHAAETAPAEPLIRPGQPAPIYWGRARFDYLIELRDAGEIAHYEPDLKRIAALPSRGLIITAKSFPPYDFVSRFFAPRYGIAEDPVTGSAHCVLGPFWEARLHKRDMLALQLSSRQGVIKVGVRGERVTLGGKAVSVRRFYLQDLESGC